MRKKEIKKTVSNKNNKGQAMIEFCLILPVLVMIMVVPITIYELIHKMITAQSDVYYALRESVDKMSKGNFREVEKRSNIFVAVPGKVKHVLGMPHIRGEIRLSGYQGCYFGTGRNKYRRGPYYRTDRQIPVGNRPDY
jgi:hypothetical protein